jgi:hypothetical protein
MKGWKTTTINDALSDSTDEEERQRTYGNQHQGLHDDWWHYYEQSNDRADQHWQYHLDIMLQRSFHLFISTLATHNYLKCQSRWHRMQQD